MVQLQDAPKGASVTSEATERELELEAQLVEARSIIQEQVLFLYLPLRHFVQPSVSFYNDVLFILAGVHNV